MARSFALTVGQRLFLLILLAIVGLGATAAISLRQIERVYDAARYAQVNTVPSIILIDDVQTAFNAIQRRLFQYVLATEAEEQQRLRQEIDTSRARLMARLDAYGPLISDERDGAMLADSRARIAEFATRESRLLALMRSAPAEQYRHYARTDLRDAIERVNLSFAAHRAYNVALGDAALKTAENNIAQAFRLVASVALVVLAGVLLLGWLIARTLLRQLGGEPDNVVTVMTRLSDGDLAQAIPLRRRDKASMMTAIKKTVDKLGQVVADVSDSAESLVGTAEEVSTTAQSISRASTEQASGVEQASMALEQIHGSIVSTSQNARLTDQIASAAASQAQACAETVSQMVAAIQQIASKIAIIDDIAYQTNLLALNATIEAAHAGEHGTGFAVVAAEVRRLAERSQAAAHEIDDVARANVSLACTAEQQLNDMVPSITRTSRLVQDIMQSSERQSEAVSQISVATTQLAQVIQQNSMSSEELAVTSEELNRRALLLQRAMAFFKCDAGGQRLVMAAQAT